MKRRVVWPVFASLLLTQPAHAVAIFAGGKPVLVHEDFVFLHQDAMTKQVHVLFAARVAPTFRRVTMGIPTPTSPTIEHVVIDLPETLHKLIAPHEMRLNKRAPAPPAPWTIDGAHFDSFVENAGSAEHVFDTAWTQSYVDKGFFIAGLRVTTPDDGRLEIMSPTAHISFTSERIVLGRREPPLPLSDGDADVGIPDKPRLPIEVTVDKVEPLQAGLGSDAIARIFEGRLDKLRACYETFLERNPNAAMKLAFETTIRPKGDVAAIKWLDVQTEASRSELGRCVIKIFEAIQMPRAADGYKIKSSITLKPPRIPARRTHIVTIGSLKYVWRNAPPSVRLEQDFEILPEDLKLAISGELRKTLGLLENGRVWVSHWLDRDARRTQAEDIEFEKVDLPAPGDSGALALDVHEAKMDTVTATVKPAESIMHANSRKSRQSFWMLGGIAITLALALWIAQNEWRG